MINFIDLFAGIGGMRLGFEQAMQNLGIQTKCVLSSEIDKYAQETYELNYKEKPEGDIYDIKQFPKFDFLLAGFPCQPFSYAGKQKGFVDTRGTLFFEIEKLLSEYQPKAFLLENVRGLTSHDQGRTFKTIIERLQNLNYGVSYLILNSSNFGIPQNRVRVYILGLYNQQPILSLKSDLGAIDFHEFKRSLSQLTLFESLTSSNNTKIVADILEANPSTKYDCSNDLEIEFMNELIANRRKKKFGTHRDGKKLNIDENKTFFDYENLLEIMNGLICKGYLKEIEGRYSGFQMSVIRASHS